MERLEDYGTVDCWLRTSILLLCIGPYENAGQERNVHRPREISSGQRWSGPCVLVEGKQDQPVSLAGKTQGAVCAICRRPLFLYVKILL